MTRVFSMMKDKTNATFFSFIENDDNSTLTLFVPLKKEEEYYLPPVTLTIKGEPAILKLYKLLLTLDKKYDLNKDFFTIKNAKLTSLSTSEPLLYVVSNRRGLSFVEPDQVLPNGYKPTKELVLVDDYIPVLYDLLQHVFGIPLSMRSKYVKDDDNQESESKKVNKTGWQMIK